MDEYVIEWFEENYPDEIGRQETVNQALIEYIRPQQKFHNRRKSRETVALESSPRPTR